MTTRRLFALVLLGFPCVGAAACSLLNSYGDVVPFDGGASAAEGGAQGSAADENPVGDAGAGDAKGPSSDGSTDGPPTGDGGNIDGSDGAPTPQGGAVVVGGTQMGDGGFVLSVLDPATGLELSREAMTVVGVQYDGLRDYWYLFENNGGVGGIYPAPSDPVYLHVRTLRTATGVWTEQARIRVPAIESTDTVALLNGRLAYTAYAVTDAGTPTGGYELVLVNTTNEMAPTLINPPTPLANLPTGTVGTRNPSDTGGTINLFDVDSNQCQGDGSAQLCSLEATHVTVPASGAPVVSPAPVTVAAVSQLGSEGFGSYLGGSDDVIAFPPANGNAGSIERFSTSNSTPIAGSTVSFATANIHLQKIAISECYSMAFVVGIPSDTQVYGVPFMATGGSVATADLGHAGQAVEFEPYTNTVIAPFKASGSYQINAYRLTGTPSALSLSNRTSNGTWSPPSDLEPNFVGVRQPIPFSNCPSL
jgi:hypothetical protein